MADRYFVPLIGAASQVRLTGDEAHHLARVCRLGRGDSVEIFDGSGVECVAVVAKVGRHEVLLDVIDRRAVCRELPFPLILGSAAPKGDRLHWLVEKATELGVSRFVPLVTGRATEQARAIRTEKLRRWVIEASKQCGRNILMDVAEPARWGDFLQSVPVTMRRFVAHPGEKAEGEGREAEAEEVRSAERPMRSEEAISAQGIALAVGPEGGFTEEEAELARAQGWVAVSLGPRILRVETAALTLVARLAL